MSSDDKETSGKLPSKEVLSLTDGQVPRVSEDWRSADGASHTSDPRIVEFVKALARWVADRDYDRLVKEGKQPWERSEADDA